MTGLDVGAVRDSMRQFLQNKEEQEPTTTYGLGAGEDSVRTSMRQFLQARQRHEDHQFALSMSSALRTDPDLAGEAQRLSAQLGGTAPDVLTIERNIDRFRMLAVRQYVEKLRLAQGDSGLMQMLTDPAFARVAHDDLDNLGATERMGDAFDQGAMLVERNTLGDKASLATLGIGPELTAAERQRLDSLTLYLESTPQVPLNAFRGLAYYFGQFSQTIPKALETGSKAGIVFGLASAAASAGPQAVITAPTGAAVTTAAFFAGFGGELLRQSKQVEGGGFYLDQIKASVDPWKAAILSQLVGVVSGGLELGGDISLAFGGRIVTGAGRQLLLRAIGRETATALAKPTMLRAGLAAATGYFGARAGESVTEGAQEATAILGENLAQIWEGLPTDLSTPEGRDAAAARIGDIMAQTWAATALIAAPGAGLHFITEAQRVRRSQADIDIAARRDALLAKSKVLARNPAAMESFLGRTLAGKRGESTFIEAARFAEALQQSGMTDEQLARDLPDIAAQLPDALATGGDIVMPTARYEARISQSDLGPLLQQHRRFDAEGYSEAELPQVQAAQETLRGQAIADTEAQVSFAESAAAVERDFLKQLNATKRLNKQEAREAAAGYRAFVETQSERLRGEEVAPGVSRVMLPEEFVKQFPVKVVRGTGAVGAEQLAQRITETEAFRKWFRESTVVDEAGKPLVVFHGTGEQFDEFTAGEFGFHFGDVAAADLLGDAMPVYLSIRNPLRTPDLGVWTPDRVLSAVGGPAKLTTEEVQQAREETDALGERLREQLEQDDDIVAQRQAHYEWSRPVRELLKRHGYDGIVYRNEAEGFADSFIAFDPTQVKSIGNRGTFDPTDPNILRQEANAAFDPATGVIALFKGSDLTSILHELSHAFLHMYSQLAASPNAPAQVVADFQAFLDWRGIEGGVEAWNALSLDEQRPHHEAWAETFEVYAFTGRAPSLELQGAFSRFRRWITRLWKNIRGQIREVPPEIRGVFDRMLASEEAIAHAESVRGLMPLFDVKPEGMTDAAWAQYQNRMDRGTERAVAEVQRRSLRDMGLLSRARDKKLRELQAKHDEVRAAIRNEIKAEVEATPLQRAIHFIRRGVFVSEAGTEVDFEGHHKLQTDAVRELVPEGTDLRTLRITSPDGLSPDQVAEMFGMDSGADLVREIVAAQDVDLARVIDDRTDARMLAEHGDLRDADALRRAIDEALHNPFRARFVATEINALLGATQPVRLMVAAARQMAKEMLSALPVAHVKPWRFQAAERRANRMALQAAAKGDTAAAIAAKRSELLQHELSREAALVEREVEKAEARLRKFTQSDRKLGAKRDLDFVLAGRALLADYGVIPKATGQAERQQTAALALLARDFAPVHTRVQTLRDASQGRLYRTLPLTEFRELYETADALWDLSLATKTLTIGDRKMAMAAVSEELQGAIAALPTRRARGATVPEGITPSVRARIILEGWHFEASLKRMQHYVLFLDRGKVDGPFDRLILRPMITQLDKYRAHRHKINSRIEQHLRKLIKLYGRRWDDRIAARADELPVMDRHGVQIPGRGYTFRGVRELADAMLDIGNPSNMAKRLASEGWAPNPKDTNGVLLTAGWDRFFQRMTDEGIITRELIEFVSSMGYEFEALREPAQKVHRALLGYDFEELPLPDVQLPEELGGTIKGWYAPLRPDWVRSNAPRLQMDALESLAELESEYENSRHSVGTGRSFTLSRDPKYFGAKLTMDIGRRVQAFDAELRFIYLQPHVRNVVRITEDEGFKNAINAYDREAIRSIIIPWLDTTARQATSRPGKNPIVDRFARFLQVGTGVAYLSWRVSVTLVQLTGLAQIGQYVSKRYSIAGARRAVLDPRAAWQEAAGKSIRMEHRLNTHTRKTEEWIRRQGLAPFPRTWDAFKKAGIRFGAMPIRVFQGFVDVAAWHGAYQQAIAEAPVNADMEAVEKKAIQDADLVVERSQGSSEPENLARLQADTPLMKLMFQFLNFSNNMLNQSLVRAGLSESRAGALFNLLWMPALITVFETAIREAVAGAPDDDDDGYLDDLAVALGVNFARNVVGMVPLAGPTIAAMARNEADRVSAAPAVGAFGSATRGIHAIAALFQGEDVTGSQIRAIGDLASIVTGWPLGPFVARPLAYERDIGLGKIEEPSSDIEHLRGLIVGR